MTAAFSVPMPARGAWVNGVFQFPMRVYYEDTDVGGMMYHARYISFFERVRTESIRGSAADVGHLFGLDEAEGGPLTYVVGGISVKYRQQSKIDQILLGHLRVKRVRAAAVELEQWITRDDILIAEAEVTLAIVGADEKPRRWPEKSRECWARWQQEAEKAI